MNTLVVICALFASSSALLEHDNGHDDHDDDHEPVFSSHFIGGAGGLQVINTSEGELEDGDKAPDEDESSVNAVMESFEPGVQTLISAFGAPRPGRRR